MFTMKKWYFDCLTPDRTYVFAYFAYVHMLGRTRGSLTIHCFRFRKKVPVTRTFNVECHLNGDDESSRCAIRMREGEITIAEDRCRLSFDRDDVSLNLRYVPLRDSSVDPLIITTGGKSRILWRPIGLRYMVSGNISMGKETLSVEEANGYVDYLHSTYLPPVVPVRTLHWGRLHHDDLDAVYVHAADSRNRRSWSTLYVRQGDTITGLNRILILEAGDRVPARSSESFPNAYEVTGTNGSSRIRLKIQHVQPVQEMGFIDQQEFQSSVVRSLVKCLTRNPRSTKFLSYADIAIDSGRDSRTEYGMPMIDEFALL